ncbi:Transcription factor [Penicillium brevicompactum]|uniref:Transcription factor n=1 Tax=Penicillium brevicompactum TaxID=5074 RepID=UPI002540F7E7|nr:Transcription factor [Penicillium brevicompactum]KAJ5325166.1 Transcription factor [Penicillium brevicompactum]
MFHTFEGFENPTATSAVRNRATSERRESISRRVTTLRACTSCRHRKIKCDGEKPCEACRWYKKSDQCHYSDPRPSRRHVEKLSTTLEEYRSILGRLFPDLPPESLVNLSREKLLELTTASAGSHVQTLSQHPESPATSASLDAHLSPCSNEDDNLESLQSMPEELPDSRNTSSTDLAEGVSDDVNALSLSARQPSSYLGVSSIQAVIKVIVWLDPGCASYFSRTPEAEQDGGIGWPHRAPITPPQPCIPPSEMQMLDAYFLYFQAFAPMIDERSFRETYCAGRRRDDHWLALLNIVLALGSIAATGPDDVTHQTYFLRCKSHLSISSLGSSHIEIVQALGLVGGWYCHYISQPNLAYSLMGAALRMAAALGLHKEFADTRQLPSPAKLASMDLKRRVWWSLFCMDTWAGMTLGRPSMGRTGSTITVKPPLCRDKENVLEILPLVENIRFAKIATQVQESLAAAPLVKHQEMAHADTQLLEWWDNLPSVLKNHEPCSESINTVRTVMRWRYYNQRILLYRPTLLSYAMRRVPYIALRSEERTAIERCREVAQQSIENIAATAQLNQLCGWNAVWWTFQASMVPLVGLFLHDPTADDPRASIESCQAQVEMAMMTLARMQSFGHTAKRSLDAISRIYEASKRGQDLAEPESAVIGLGGSYPAGRDLSLLFTSPSDPCRSNTTMTENGFLDPLATPFTDDSGGQYLWEYLSWSDNSLWPGIVAEVDGRNDAMALLTPDHDKGPKYGDQPAYFDPMPESGYGVHAGFYY